MSDHLSDLLERRAAQAGRMSPSMEGVQAAIDRRRVRRGRQRLAGTGLAVVCVAAGIAGGVALSGDDGGETEGFTGPLPEVPIVGIDVPGFELVDAVVEPTDHRDPPLEAVVFRPDGSLAGPLMSVAVDPGSGDGAPADPEDTPVDLDADGRTDGPRDGRLTSTPSGGVGVTWTLADGRTVGVGGYGIAEDEVLRYAETLNGDDLDVALVEAPDGLPHRSDLGVPSGQDTERAIANYRNGDREIQVRTTNEPGWFDYVQLYSVSTYAGFEEAEVGDSFLGPAEGIVSTPVPDFGFALVRTESGLTVEVSTDGASTDADELRELLADARFVEVEPLSTSTTTTGVMASTTLPPTTTAVVSSSDSGAGGSGTGQGRLERLTVQPVPDADRIVLTFADGIPAYEVTSSAEPTQPGEGDCPDVGDPGAAYLRVRLDIPSTGDPTLPPAPEPGYGALNVDPDGVVQGANVPCSWFEGVVWVDISLNRAADFRIAERADPFQLVIDVPR